jgi:tol-pal system protein YbgF
MRVKTKIAAKLIAASLLIPIFFTATKTASAVGNDQRVPEFGVEVEDDSFVPVPQADVPLQRPVILAQADGQRVLALEETIRQMNGKVEELTFQILQMQEQMRKMQEDNEFRFQELEKSKQGRAKSADENTDTAAAPAADQSPTEEAAAPVEAAPEAPADVAASGGGAQTGAPEKPLGSIKFDQSGNVVGGSIEQVIEEDTQTAALPTSGDPSELYRVSYDHVLAGEYKEAEAGFRQHIEQFPADGQTADARYWLGESLAAQGRNRDAAEVFLAAQKDFPKSKKAPEMLFKLGVSLIALDNKDVACATFNQVTKKYPKSGQALLARVAEEQSKAGC